MTPEQPEQPAQPDRAWAVAWGAATDVGRVRAEDRVLASNPDHAAYAQRVRWRMVPGVW